MLSRQCLRLGGRLAAGPLGRPAAQRSSAQLQPRRLLSTTFPAPPGAFGGAPSPSAAAESAATPVAQAVPRAVGWWLLGSATSVFGMVVLGGCAPPPTPPRLGRPARAPSPFAASRARPRPRYRYTRLTRSGLSMTDWKPQGTLLPSGEAEWQAAFQRYQQFPEFQLTNSKMGLDEFQQIYFVEWAHRMAGRAVGLVYGLPLLGFALAGQIPRALAPRLGLLLALGGSQGLVGWWMVKSGLEAPPADLDGVPRVSPYRLACHLTMAFTIYSLLLATSLQILWPQPHGDAKAVLPTARRALSAAGGPAKALSALIAVTALSGAFVAGMHAGYSYNTFPLMEGKLFPDGYWRLSPAHRNFFENVPAVQFDHRLLAVSTLGGVGAFWTYARSLPLPPAARLASHALLAGAAGQVALGVATLLHAVPVELGTAHQAGALSLFSITLVLLHTLRRLPL